MQQFLPLTSLILVLSTLTRACMHYHAIIPFSPDLPVTANITDNGVLTCLLSQSYASHEVVQGIFQKNLLRGNRLPADQRAPSLGKKGKSKRSGNERISLTAKKPLKANAAMWDSRGVRKSVWDSYLSGGGKVRVLKGSRKMVSPEREKSVEEKREGERMREKERLVKEERVRERVRWGETEEEIWGTDDEGEIWMKWYFTCIDWYRARMEPGGRSVVYWAHGQDFFFNPKEREDVDAERWEYEISLWCGKKNWKGKNKDEGVESTAEHK